MEAQDVVSNVEDFCRELICLKSFHDVVKDFTQCPINKAQAVNFINETLKAPITHNGDINQTLIKLTINPSEFNSEQICSLLTSHRSVGVRHRCAAISAQARRLITQVLKLIKVQSVIATEMTGVIDADKLCELKRSVLMLKAIFNTDRDVALKEEQLIELPVCEETLKKDLDELITDVKCCLDETCGKVWFSLHGDCHKALNENNWQSVKALIARTIRVAQD